MNKKMTRFPAAHSLIFIGVGFSEGYEMVSKAPRSHFPKPPLDGLRKRLKESRDSTSQQRGAFIRESFRLPRLAAREKAREWFEQYPKAAYWTEIESWHERPGDIIEFTMRRLPNAD
jgi:hypothetical protein